MEGERRSKGETDFNHGLRGLLGWGINEGPFLIRDIRVIRGPIFWHTEAPFLKKLLTADYADCADGEKRLPLSVSSEVVRKASPHHSFPGQSGFLEVDEQSDLQARDIHEIGQFLVLHGWILHHGEDFQPRISRITQMGNGATERRRI